MIKIKNNFFIDLLPIVYKFLDTQSIYKKKIFYG